VDGDCGEYAALGAHRETVDQHVTLTVHQDSHFVWLCYTLPPNSFGFLDLRIASAVLAKPLNLHVSAQLGEWPADEPDLAPRGEDSELWWTIDGWTANWQWYHGVDASGSSPKPIFKFAPGREVQLSKQRFGDGVIELVLNIGRIRRADGREYSLRFPQSGVYTLSVGNVR
jgi:hypothetical protein